MAPNTGPASRVPFELLASGFLVLVPVVEITTTATATAATPLAAITQRRYRSAGFRRAFVIAARNAQDSCSEGAGDGSARMSASVARKERKVAEHCEQPVRCCSRSSRSVPVSSPST